MVSSNDMHTLITEVIAMELHLTPSDIDPRTSFYNLGLDSVNSIFLIGELESKLGIDIDPMSVYNNPTIESFSEYLLSILNE